MQIKAQEEFKPAAVSLLDEEFDDTLAEEATLDNVLHFEAPVDVEWDEFSLLEAA